VGRHPTMTKRKHALLLGSLASDRSNTGLRLGVRFTPLVLMSESGPSRHFAALRNLAAIGAISDSRQPNALKIYGFAA
jgi:hypothetical protein